MTTRVFVYGSLLSGEPNHHRLAGARLVHAARTQRAYRLHDLGFFPAAVRGGDVAISGEVYEVDLATLEILDRLEGHPRFYRRSQVMLDDGEWVQMYLLGSEQVAGHPEISTGDWRAQRATTMRAT